MCPVKMQVIIPSWLYIVAPVVGVLHLAGIITTDHAARIIAWGVRVRAIHP